MEAYKTSFWRGIIKESSGRLHVVDRINEVIFGLIMVLTFTCTMNAATAGREEVGTVLWAALGCNVAWGIVDAFIYLFTTLMFRGESLDAVHQIHNAKADNEANEALRDALPPLLSELMDERSVSDLRTKIKELPAPPSKTIFTWNDIFGAVKVFFLVFLSTFPVVIPFIFIHDVFTATRVSNGIALILLFITGYYFGKKTHYKPLGTGFMLAAIGALLVLMTIALGG